MTLSSKKIQKIQNLRTQGTSVRNIAKRLKISTDSVIKYGSHKCITIQPAEIVRMPAQQSKEPIKRVDNNRYSNSQYYDRYRTNRRIQYWNRPRIHSIETRQTNSEFKNFIEAITTIKQIQQEKQNQEDKKRMQFISEDINRLRKSITMRENREREEKQKKEMTRHLSSTDQYKKTESRQIKEITNLQNKETEIVLPPAVNEKKDSIPIQIKDTEQETQGIDIGPWVVAGLKVTNELGVPDYLGSKIGEWLLKPNKPKKVTLREVPLEAIPIAKIIR